MISTAARRQTQNKRSSDKAARSKIENRLQQAFERLEKVVHIFDRHYQFQVIRENETVLRANINQATGEVINEVPPEKILDLEAQIQELVGLLIDKRA